MGGLLEEKLRIVDPINGRISVVSMPEGRFGGAAVTLEDGRVLLLGGRGTRETTPLGTQKVARLFSPSDQTFSPAIEMVHRRRNPFPALFPNGRVLVLGATEGSDYEATQTTEWFDPMQLGFRPGPELASVYGIVGVSPLPGDRLLVVGTPRGDFADGSGRGQPGKPVQTAIDLFEPGTGTFRVLPPLADFEVMGAVTLPNGRCWVLGWDVQPSAEAGTYPGRKGKRSSRIFDPETLSFTRGPAGLAMLSSYETFYNSACRPLGLSACVPLDDTRVFFLGMSENGGSGIFDLDQDSFTPLKGREGRTHGLGVVLPLKDGRLLVAGGWTDLQEKRTPTPSVEVLDPASGRYSQLPRPVQENGRLEKLMRILFPVVP